MASSLAAPRPLPGRDCSQPAVPVAGVWWLGAADDAYAAEQGCGVLPAVSPDPRGRGGARARLAPHVPFPVLLALGRQAAISGRRVPCRDGAAEGFFLNRPGIPSGLAHGV